MTKKYRKSLKRRSSSQVSSVAKNRFGSLKRLIKRLVSSFAHSPMLLSIPLSLLFFFQLTDFLVLLNFANDATSLLFFGAMPVTVEDIRRPDAEALKRQVQAALYLYIFVMVALNWRSVYQYFRHWPHIVLLIVLLLLSATYSTEPTKVVTNTILFSISFLAPILLSIGYSESRKRLIYFYVLILLPFLVSHSSSLLLFFSYNSDILAFIESPQRYGGFSGNPNSLGNTAVIGIWACTALVLSSQANKVLKLIGAISALIFMLSIALSGSGTALVASLIVVTLLLGMRFYSGVGGNARVFIAVFGSGFLAVCLMSILVFTTPAELYLMFTGSLGKDATMTGRTEIWDIAKEAIAQRPLLGWSYDSHATVKLERAFAIEYNHFHNGYLDVLISGGFVLLALVVYHLGVFCRVFVSQFRKNSGYYSLAVPMIMLLILNISEYSLLRPLSEIWELYVCSFVLLTFNVSQSKRRETSVLRVRKKRKSALRWA